MSYLPNNQNIVPERPSEKKEHLPYFQHFPGAELLQEIDDFYISYGNWRSEYPENFHCFSLIKRIAQISTSGGGYLSDKEEKALICHLNDLKEGLYEGSIKHSQIPRSMNQMLLNLIEHNPKAKLIAHIIELEYFFYDFRKVPMESHAGLYLTRTIISKVTPSLSEANAHTAAKELSLFLTKLAKDRGYEKEILQVLESAIKNHLGC